MKIEPGARVGYLEVLRDSGNRVGTYKIWECRCTNCGRICYKSTGQLKTAKSCGCYRKQRMSVSGPERSKVFKQDKELAGMNHSLRDKPNINNHSSGIRGVSWEAKREKWTVQIMHKKKAYNLGRYDSLSAAADIRKKAETAVRNGCFEEWIKNFKDS